MTTLRSQLTELAQSFADSVISAIRGASLQDLLSERAGQRSARAAKDGEDGATRTRPGRQKPGRLRRRTPEEIGKAVDLVTKLVKSQPKGLRAEEIRKKLGLDVREVPRILKEGLAKKQLRSKGQKRATTYFAA
jgi:DNA invertase Pin-like site-specific DNA recombinase